MQTFIQKYILPLIFIVAFSAAGFAQTVELPLPKIPKELRKPQERAAYLIEHFWDAMDFSDTLRSRNRLFVEQNLANYLSLFPHAPQQDLPRYVAKLTRASEADAGAFRLFAEFSEIYLNRYDSPMRNEEYYILFMEAQLASKQLGADGRSRLGYRLKEAKKNRPGTVAADFSFRTRKGKRSSLHRTKASKVLVMFYSTDCEHCRTTVAEVAADVRISSLIERKELAVLAVCVDDGRKQWDALKASLPQSWIVGYAGSKVSDKGLYALPSLPVIYLLDGDKRVLLKDAGMGQVMDSLIK